MRNSDQRSFRQPEPKPEAPQFDSTDPTRLSPQGCTASLRRTDSTRAEDLLTDEGRERAIVASGLEMQRAMREWEHTGCFAARGRADFWRVCMERDIHARSPEQVARMEQERGLHGR